ncbi:MAG TPA: protein-disulfide reductase DsbD domain-containing protein [Fimbriimonadaceae bacterium]|nr:protein-disulfide reductase DsbD domain-containing protein [Fimbriimonadaceae bacterium]
MLAFAALIALSPKATDYSKPALLSSSRACAPGRRFLVGLEFKIKPGWHVYWHNPGDSGQEIRVKWSLPAGWQAGPLMWPTPEVMLDTGFVNYGYEKQVTLLCWITPASRKGTIRANLDWLVCDKEMCLPGKRVVSLPIPTANASVTAIAAALERVPQPLRGQADARLAGKTVTLRVELPKGAKATEFMPFDPAVIHNSARQNVSTVGDSAVFKLDRSEYFDPKRARLRGIVVGQGASPHSSFFNEIDVPLERTSGG